MNYRLAYAIGFHPWEDAAADPPFVAKAAQMFDHEERGRQPPYGRALDLGTGSGIWGIELAKRGWQVTGVDLVEKALRRVAKTDSALDSRRLPRRGRSRVSRLGDHRRRAFVFQSAEPAGGDPKARREVVQAAEKTVVELIYRLIDRPKAATPERPELAGCNRSRSRRSDIVCQTKSAFLRVITVYAVFEEP